jgi:hypothetical protein
MLKLAQMKLNKEEIKKIAEAFLDKNNISRISVGEPVFFNSAYTGNSLKINHWSVPYEYKVFENEVAAIRIDDTTGKIIHVMTKHGYEYINGERTPEPIEDDGEDWSDI